MTAIARLGAIAQTPVNEGLLPGGTATLQHINGWTSPRGTLEHATFENSNPPKGNPPKGKPNR